MRITPFWLVLSLLLSVPLAAPTARADDSEPKRAISDGLTVSAMGQGGDFRRHWLVVIFATADQAPKSKAIAALESLGLKGAAPEGNNPFSLSLLLPEGKCDGQRIGSISRLKLLETLEATGGVHRVMLRSYYGSSTAAQEAAQKQALSAAMKAAREKAQAIAREGGGQLGTLLGMEYEAETIGEARVLLLTQQGVQEQEQGGDKIRVEARYAFRK